MFRNLIGNKIVKKPLKKQQVLMSWFELHNYYGKAAKTNLTLDCSFQKLP